RAVADSVRSTLGPKGMDKMLVSSMGDVTVTNDGVTILTEMDINNPTAEMIVEVAETQEDEAGDGTTTAVAVAGELLKNAEGLIEQDIHPTAIMRGFDTAEKQARAEIDDIAEQVEADDTDSVRQVDDIYMTRQCATTTTVVLADQNQKNSEGQIEHNNHPTAIMRGFDTAAKQARAEIDDIAEQVEADDTDRVRKVAETSMTGKGAEANKEQLADLI